MHSTRFWDNHSTIMIKVKRPTMFYSNTCINLERNVVPYLSKHNVSGMEPP